MDPIIGLFKVNAKCIVLKRPFSSIAKDQIDLIGFSMRHCSDNAVINNA